MISSDIELSVNVERGRSVLRVSASTCEGTASLAVQATFSAGPEGTWFQVERSGKTRVFSHEVVARHRPFSALLRLIADEVELCQAPNEALLGLLFRSLLVYVSRMTEMVPLPRWGRPVRDRRIERALDLLEADLSKYWTVELLARAVGLSRPVFAREFVRMLEVSPIRYLANRRMQLAADLLLHTDAGLAEIAARVGYQSEFAFGRAFKRYHQLAPGTFRRRPIVAQSAALRLVA